VNSFIRLAALLISAFLFPFTIQAQIQNAGRIQVGVALSGGGALGLAHIGVIRYFEEHHIPIDDIAGTSMGGLVAGFYAVGMNSKQLTKVVEEADWNALLNPSPRFIDQPIVEKQKWNRAFGDLTLRFGKKFSLPAGLNPGELLSLLLSRDTLAYSDISDFDELPTPFRCVATDLISGNAIVLKQGSLAQAMRATMSIPAVFTPVKQNGMVLVDGGLVENIPVQVVREMGATTVIAVALETSTPKPEQLRSFADILRQSVSVAVAQNERRSLASADLIISVDTTKFSSTDYSSGSQAIIEAGYQAATRKAAELSKFEMSPEEWARYLQLRSQRVRPAKEQGAVVAVVGPSESFRQKAQAEIERKLHDRAVSQNELEPVLSGMVAATSVPGAAYEWQQGEGKPEGYKVTFFPRAGEQLLAKVSVLYGISPGEPQRATLRFSTATTFENTYKSRLLGTIDIGYDPGLRTEYYHPFGGSGYFIATGLLVDRYHVNQYDGSARLSDTRDRFGGSLYGGIGTWRFAQLRLGAQLGYDSYSSSPIVDGVKANSSVFASPEIRWIYNSQDSGGLPTHGTRDEGSIGYSLRNVPYPYLQNDFGTTHPINKKLSFIGTSRIDSSLGRKLDYFEQFTGGGHGQLSAFRYQEFHANTVLTAGAGAILHGPSLRSLSISPNLAMWYELGRFDQGSQGWRTHQSTSTGIFFPTAVGAAGFSVSFDEFGKARLRLILGWF
jgi:NTE family protein